MLMGRDGLYMDDNERRSWDAFQCDQLNKTEVGMFILCKSKEPNSTRLFINRFSSYHAVTSKDGWWDTFTISDMECDPGYYVCKINRFRIDKNGYLNCLVTPYASFGSSIDYESIAWDLFFGCNIFSKMYAPTKNSHLRFNVMAVYDEFKDDIEEAAKKIFENNPELPMEWCRRRFIFEKFIDGEISFQRIEELLNKPSEIEGLAIDLLTDKKFRNSIALTYPLVIKKYPKYEDTIILYNSHKKIQDWLEHNMIRYDELKLGDSDIILERVEAVLKYYEQKKIAEKEERKAKRKAAKNK